MRIAKKILKSFFAVLLILAAYFLLSLVLTFIPINVQEEDSEKDKSIYLNSNGIHLDIVIPRVQLNSKFLDGLYYSKADQYFSFGWGDTNFYLNTPSWNDLTMRNACHALFLKGPTLIHLSRYTTVQKDWVEIKINQSQLNKIKLHIYQTFYLDSLNKIRLLPDKGYSSNDDFFEAMGSLSCFKTCNSWVNTGLKRSGIKACLWTPFDFGLLHLHRKQTPVSRK